MSKTDIAKRLLEVETGDGTGDHVVHFYRNPDGPEAADEIRRLRKEVVELLEQLRGVHVPHELAMLRDLRDSWYGVREMMQKQLDHLEAANAALRVSDKERWAMDVACINLMETTRRGRDKGHPATTLHPLDSAREVLRAFLGRIK